MLLHNRNLAIIAALAFSAAPMLAQQEGPVPTSVLIHAQSKNDAPLDPSKLMVQVEGHTTPITNVAQILPTRAQVAILIDDGLRGSFGNQLKDMENFIYDLPTGTQVMIGYMRNGEIKADGGFSADHEAVARMLRIPISSAGVSASPYFCLSEFVKHWPSNVKAPRFVLMITNGVDPYNGSTSIMNQDSPYVQTAQEDAERAGAAVYSIYYGNAGMGGVRANVSGQNYLAQVAAATGGESLYSLEGNPVSLAPFLKDFRKDINESYTVSFMADAYGNKPNTLARVKVKTTQSGVKIHAPENVHPGMNDAQ